MTYDPNKPIMPRIARTLEECLDMMYHEGFARVLPTDRNRIKAAAHRRGYKWTYKREGRYIIIRLKVVE